jgi:hypothetical protein
MDTPPDEFIEEYQQMRERMDWVAATLGRGQDLAQAKEFVALILDFFNKWEPVITIPSICEGMKNFRERVESKLVVTLEKIYLAHLNEVLNARREWIVGELFLKAAISFAGLMKESPPELRPQLEEIHRTHMGCEYDPEADYRETEADTAAKETAYRKALASFRVDWGERVDAAMVARLENLDIESLNAWQAEINAQNLALNSPR